jgi:hypothetical protein
MATKSLTSGVKHELLKRLTASTNTVLLGVGGVTPWPIEAVPPDVDPLTTSQPDVQAFLETVVQAAVAKPSNYSGPGATTVGSKTYRTTTDAAIIKSENMNLLYVTASFKNNTTMLFPEADYRSFGLYQNCIAEYLPINLSPLTYMVDPPWYQPAEVTQAELFYLEHFQAVEAVVGVVEQIQLLVRV